MWIQHCTRHSAITELNPCRPVKRKSLKTVHFPNMDLSYSNICLRSKQRANEPACIMHWNCDHCSTRGSLYKVKYLELGGTDSSLGNRVPSWASGSKTFEVIDHVFHLLWKNRGLKLITKHLGVAQGETTMTCPDGGDLPGANVGSFKGFGEQTAVAEFLIARITVAKGRSEGNWHIVVLSTFLSVWSFFCSSCFNPFISW